MAKLSIKDFDFETIIDELNNRFLKNHISNVVIFNSKMVILHFSFYRKGKLFISLDKNEPLIFEGNYVDSYETINNGFSMQLRHHIKDGFIYNIEQFNDDSIIKIDFKRSKSEFEYESKSIYIELIPLKPNIIVTNEENKIVFASHYDKEKRNIENGNYYVPPIKEHEIKKENNYNYMDLMKYGEKVFKSAIPIRRKEKFSKSFNFVKNKIKLLKKKIPILNEEIKDGQEGLIYKDLGDSCYYLNQDELINLFIDNNKKFDTTKTPIENAQHCFKLYKKAKNKINEATKQLQIANDDLNYFEHLQIQLTNGNENDLKQIEVSLFPDKKVLKHDKKIIKNYQPYFIKHLNATFYFGHNDLQNDHLTFKLAHYNDTFMHIHNYPGAHIVIKSNKINNEQLLFGAEMALILSNKEAGDIDYCLIKHVKKGGKLGLVKLKEYKTIHLNKVNLKTKQLIKAANR